MSTGRRSKKRVPSPTDKMLPLDTEEAEKLKRWRSEFQQDFNIHRMWFDKKREWERFYDGDQLTEEEKRVLGERLQPEVVINLIKPRIDGIIGDFLGRRVMMRARDRGNQDFESAKHITEALRYIEDQNRFDDSEQEVAEDLMIGGVGWYKVSLEFDFLEPEIRIAHRNNNDIVIDRRCRKVNLSDAKRLYEAMWVEMEDLIEVFPQHEEFIREGAEMDVQTWEGWAGIHKTDSQIGDNYQYSEDVSADTGINFETFLDPNRKRLRLINIWERVQKRVEFAFHPAMNGSVVEITDFTDEERSQLKNNFPGAQIFTRTRWEINSGIFIANKILEDKENVRPHDSAGKFPFARAVGHFEHGENHIPYGMVRQYIDPQREYNKRRSKLLHKSNVNRIIAEEGAVAGQDIERIRAEAAKPDGVVMHKPGRAFQIDKDQPNQTDVYLLELSHSEIERSGVSREFIGQENKVLSGHAINLRQIDGQKMLRPFFAALRSARRDAFAIVLEEIQQYWTSEKLIKITDDPEAGQIVLNQRAIDPLTGRPVILNNLRLGKYDIKIDEDAETPNQRQEIFDQLVSLASALANTGEPLPIEMIIKSSNLPNKKEWLDQIALRRQQQQQMQLAQMQQQAQAGAGRNGQAMTPMM